jgi:hypothetical protein
MSRVIGMDIHRTFAEVVFWEEGGLRWHGRVDMTRSGLEGFGRSLTQDDEVVVEATGNAMAVVRVLGPYVARVIIANPLQVKAIAHARIKTDKIDAGVLASLRAAGFRQSGLGLAQHGRISKVGRAHARALLVEAAWAAAKAPGPLHAFFVRIRARRGQQVAAVATARKMAVLVWHLLSKSTDYLWARPGLVAHKLRALELQAGRPMQKGNRRGPAYAYNVKALRDQEMAIAEQAERAYEHLVGPWRPRPARRRTDATNTAGSS